MSKVVDTLMQATGITVIILSQHREYEYDYDQTSLLNELVLRTNDLTQGRTVYLLRYYHRSLA